MKAFLVFIILTLSLTYSSAIFAQEILETEAPPTPLRHWQFGPRLMLWQEKIPANDNTGDLDYRARFSAIAIGATYKRSFGNHKWMQSHGADIILGSVRAASTSAGNPDLTSEQSFWAVQVSPGLSYRTTPTTLLGFSTPIYYRDLDWKQNRTGLDIGSDTLITLGFALNASWILENGSMVTTGLTYRYETVMWTLAYDFSFF